MKTIAAASPPRPPRVGTDDDVAGVVHHVRRLKGRAFLHLWLPHGLVQVVVEGEPAAEIRTGAAIAVHGRWVAATLRDPTLAHTDVELRALTIEVLSSPAKILPFDVTKPTLSVTPETMFDLRPLTLRHPRVRAVFRIEDALCSGFREHLAGRGFTELHTPKIVAEGAEGGANVFELGYFGRKAYLAQSPQFYKEFGTGAFLRVYEVGPVFRAEPHATSRHLNEYTSLDIELGPIRSFEDVMAEEVAVLRAMFDTVRARCAHEIALLGVELPTFDTIPVLPFAEAKRWSGDTDVDLSPSEEVAISRRIKEETGSDLVFVTRFPSVKRPFYVMDDPEDPTVTASFDLLFRGNEITTGGQRIHDPEVLARKMRLRGMDPENFGFFTVAHTHGLPPHGGFGLGLERLAAKLCGLDNVRDATLFPRDAHRLTP